jgi:hypothetical protein
MVFLSRVSRSNEIQSISYRLLTAAERNQVDEFFTQSSLTIKPVVRKGIRWDCLENFFSLAAKISPGYIYADEFKRSFDQWTFREEGKENIRKKMSSIVCILGDGIICEISNALFC